MSIKRIVPPAVAVCLCAAAALLPTTGPAPVGAVDRAVPGVTEAPTPGPAPRARYVVTLGDLDQAAAIARDHDLTVGALIPALNAARFDGEPDRLARLRADARIRSATRDVVFQVAGDCCDGDDHSEAGEQVLLDAHTRMTEVYGPLRRHATGAGVLVAVLDTGVDSDHPDLAQALLPGRTHVPEPWDEDTHGHGTAMASLIAGRAQPNAGVEGVAPQAKILPIRVAGRSGRAALSDVAAGIVSAVDRGAHVVLLSLGARLPAPTLDAAITYAEDRGVLVVAAAGNRNVNQDLHPAADPRVLSVGCVEDSGTLAVSTALAPTTDLLAPGVAVLACAPRGGRIAVTGSSTSAACVAGVAALVRSRHPTLDLATLRGLLRNATRPNPLFAAHPDVARAFPAGVLDVPRLVAELNRSAPTLRLSDPRVLPARAPANSQVTASIRVVNPGLRPTAPTTATLAGATVAVPALQPGEARLLRATVTASPGPIAFRLGAASARATLAPSAAPVRALAIARLSASTTPAGGLSLHATLENRGGGASAPATLGLRLGQVILADQTVPGLALGAEATLTFHATPAQVRTLPAEAVFQATASLGETTASVDLLRPTASPRPAKVQYQQNGKLNIIADAPYRLEPGRTYVPLLVFVAEKGDQDSSTWVELDRVTVRERATPTGAGNVLYDDVRMGTTTAVPNLVILEEDHQPARRGGAPDLRLFRHDRIAIPGRYAILRLPRDAFGIAPVPPAVEQRFVAVDVNWTNRRKFLFLFARTRTGTQKWTLRVNFAAQARPQLPGGGHYYDAHVHTIAEWHQEDTINIFAPRKNLGGPIPMVKEVSHAIGLTDAVDAVRGRVITTDHNAFLNSGDTLKERPQRGPTSPSASNGKGEFERYRDLFGQGAAEEVTFHGSNPFLSSGPLSSLALPTGSHMLTYRGQHIRGPWHGGSNLARAFGDNFPDVELRDVLNTLAKTNRAANAQAATYASHPYSTSLGWKPEHYQIAFEHDPTQRTDLPVHAEQTGFVTKGLQIWNGDGERHTMPRGAIDWDDVNPWKNPDWQAGDADWDSRLNRGLGAYHKDHVEPLLQYELKARPGVRFPRKVLLVAGNDAHGDFNFGTSRQGTIIPGAYSVKGRAYGAVTTYALPDLQPAGATPTERAFQAFVDGNSLLTDGPLCAVSVDAEDRFDGGSLTWHDARSTHEDRDGRVGGGGGFDGRGTALVPRGSTHLRYGYRYANIDEFGATDGTIRNISIFRTSVGDPNPATPKPSGSEYLAPRGALATGGPNQDLDEAIDAGEEGLITTPSALQFAAFTGADPATMAPDERRCLSNLIWLMPFDARADVARTETDANGKGVIPPGALTVTFDFDVSLTPSAYRVEIKALDANGDSSDQATGAIDVLAPATGSTGWTDRNGVKDSTFTVTNTRPIPLDLIRYPTSGSQVTFAVYFFDAPKDPFGNDLNRPAFTFTTPGIGTGGGTGPALARSASATTAPGATAPGTSAPVGGRSSSGGCALGGTTLRTPALPALAFLLLTLGLGLLRRNGGCTI